MRALLVLMMLAGTAEAGRDACERGTKWRGARIEVDVKDADLHEVFRLIADVGRINVVVGDDVRGAVTMRLRQVPWDQALCAVAASKRLEVTADGSVYLIRARAK